jgi:hypothetical protein
MWINSCLKFTYESASTSNVRVESSDFPTGHNTALSLAADAESASSSHVSILPSTPSFSPSIAAAHVTVTDSSTAMTDDIQIVNPTCSVTSSVPPAASLASPDSGCTSFGTSQVQQSIDLFLLSFTGMQVNYLGEYVFHFCFQAFSTLFNYHPFSSSIIKDETA